MHFVPINVAKIVTFKPNFSRISAEKLLAESQLKKYTARPISADKMNKPPYKREKNLADGSNSAKISKYNNSIIWISKLRKGCKSCTKIKPVTVSKYLSII